MGYSEKKDLILKDLEAAKKARSKALVIATTEKIAKEKSLAGKTIINDNDNNDYKSMAANLDASILVRESINSLLADIEPSCANARELHKEALGMTKIMHIAALKTVELAETIAELNTHINHEAKLNPLISKLLLEDCAKAITDAETSVTLVTKAFVDSMTAVSSVCHLNSSLTETKALLQQALPIMTNKTKGLEEVLGKLMVNAEKICERSLKEKIAAETALKEATNKFNDATADNNIADAAFTAATAAIEQSN